MDLLRTILIYMSMVFVSSVQTAPEAALLPLEPTALPTVIAQAVTATPAPTPSSTPVPTPAITPNTDYKTLQVGDKGDKVTTLQRRLAELGYYTGNVDGVYGNQTRRAVERFQYYHGLSSDGIAGKRTQTVLYESKDIVFAPVDVTPSPSPATTPGPTNTPPPAATYTPAPTATPTSSATPAPTYTPMVAPSAPLAMAVSTDTPVPPSAPVITDSPVPEDTSAFTQEPQDGVATPAASEAEPTPAQEEESPPPQEEETPALPEETPAAEAPPPAPWEGYSFLLEGQDQPVMTVPQPGIDPVVLPPLRDAEEAVLVPLLRILQDAGIWVVPQEDTGHSEYAFAIGEDLYQLSFDIDQGGNPTGLAIFKNNEPQLMDRRVAVLADGILYLYQGDVEKITGIAFTLEEGSQVYTVTVPAHP